MAMKIAIQGALARLGLEVRRTAAVSNMYKCLVDFAREQGAATVIDAGANIGQFAQMMLGTGWDGAIVSFEPLVEAHAALSATARRHARWEVAPRAALGRAAGEATINVAANSQSSSLLPMTERVRATGDNLDYVRKEQVTVLALQDWIATRPAAERFLLKLDVQGFERDVLEGAGDALERCPVIHTEMSLQEHYVGEALFPELSRFIMDKGYRCVGVRPGYFDRRTREIIQVDATFIR